MDVASGTRGSDSTSAGPTGNCPATDIGTDAIATDLIGDCPAIDVRADSIATN